MPSASIGLMCTCDEDPVPSKAAPASVSINVVKKTANTASKLKNASDKFDEIVESAINFSEGVKFNLLNNEQQTKLRALAGRLRDINTKLHVSMDKAHKDNDETFANQVVTLLNNAVTTYIKDVEDVVKTPSLPTVKGSAAAPPPSAPQPPPSSSPAARPSITPVNESPPSLLSQIQGITLKKTDMGKKLGITGGGRRTRKGKGRDRRRTRRVNRK